MSITDGDAEIAALKSQAAEHKALFLQMLDRARLAGVDSRFIDGGHLAIEGGATTRDELLSILDQMITMQLTVAELSSAALLSNLTEGADSLRTFTDQIRAAVQAIGQIRQRGQEERQSYAERLAQAILDLGGDDGGS